MFERHFVLTPWVREKRLRNQLRLILKDHLDAGPQRRSTTTKLVHDAHQVFPVWRNQIREKVEGTVSKLFEGRKILFHLDVSRLGAHSGAQS